MRRRYVASTSLQRDVPTGNLAPLGPPQYSKPWPPQYSKPSDAYVEIKLGKKTKTVSTLFAKFNVRATLCRRAFANLSRAFRFVNSG